MVNKIPTHSSGETGCSRPGSSSVSIKGSFGICPRKRLLPYADSLIMMKYSVSPRTDFHARHAGIPGLEFSYKDHIQSANDFEQKIYTLQLENRSTYFGYQIWAATGIRYDEKCSLNRIVNSRITNRQQLFVKIFLVLLRKPIFFWFWAAARHGFVMPAVFFLSKRIWKGKISHEV